ncbi:MAG: hypothetical protein KBC38_02715 [Candidatus Pacebacteria bacterium]|nr:hypothetical protein [Candidatus Paceibacterota bacterium]MBP9840331.1 hypothetical protein [Candidatus Paceibacterota bacterium]
MSSKGLLTNNPEVIDSKYGFGRDPGDEDPERITKLRDAEPLPKAPKRPYTPHVVAADRHIASPDGA